MNWEPVLCTLQGNLQVQVLCQVLLENNLFTLFEKNCYTRYLLLNVLIINFLVLYFASNFILIVGANISWNTSYFKSFSDWDKVWNKLYKVQTDTILKDILYPEVVLYKQISAFTITKIFLMISNLQHVIPKLWYCTLNSCDRR